MSLVFAVGIPSLKVWIWMKLWGENVIVVLYRANKQYYREPEHSISTPKQLRSAFMLLPTSDPERLNRRIKLEVQRCLPAWANSSRKAALANSWKKQSPSKRTSFWPDLVLNDITTVHFWLEVYLGFGSRCVCGEILSPTQSQANLTSLTQIWCFILSNPL